MLYRTEEANNWRLSEGFFGGKLFPLCEMWYLSVGLKPFPTGVCPFVFFVKMEDIGSIGIFSIVILNAEWFLLLTIPGIVLNDS